MLCKLLFNDLTSTNVSLVKEQLKFTFLWISKYEYEVINGCFYRLPMIKSIA